MKVWQWISRALVVLVLISIVVILVPTLLSQRHENDKMKVIKEIPVEPAMPKMKTQASAAVQPTAISEKVAASAEPAADTNETGVVPSTASATPASLNTSGALQAKAVSQTWIVQLDNISNIKDAQLMLQSLRQSGLTAFIHETQDKPPLIQIYIGPVANKNQASAILARVNTQFKVAGSVQPFNANQIY